MNPLLLAIPLGVCALDVFIHVFCVVHTCLQAAPRQAELSTSCYAAEQSLSSV